MLNTSDFSIRLQQVMDYYGLNAAAFADTLEIQRSGISHLLSERNKPSLDFILKAHRKISRGGYVLDNSRKRNISS